MHFSGDTTTVDTPLPGESLRIHLSGGTTLVESPDKGRVSWQKSLWRYNHGRYSSARRVSEDTPL